MTLTLEVAPETGNRQEEKARRQGQPLMDYVQGLLDRDAETLSEARASRVTR